VPAAGYPRTYGNDGSYYPQAPRGYYAQTPRGDDDQRYADRRPYYGQRDWRNDPPPLFPFFFGR
jgi:hypothetical protein